MATEIKLKRSSVAARVPTTTQLELGEIAINTHDGLLFIKKDDGTESIVQIGGVVGNAYSRDSFVATSGQTTFTTTYSADLLEVYLNGVLLKEGSNLDYTYNTTSKVITLQDAATAGDELDAITFSSEPIVNSNPTVSAITFGDWQITESNGSLYFATGGTNKMKLDANGNLDVVGNVNSNATIT
jgi:hypothetical protein